MAPPTGSADTVSCETQQPLPRKAREYLTWPDGMGRVASTIILYILHPLNRCWDILPPSSSYAQKWQGRPREANSTPGSHALRHRYNATPHLIHHPPGTSKCPFARVSEPPCCQSHAHSTHTISLAAFARTGTANPWPSMKNT